MRLFVRTLFLAVLASSSASAQAERIGLCLPTFRHDEMVAALRTELGPAYEVLSLCRENALDIRTMDDARTLGAQGNLRQIAWLQFGSSLVSPPSLHLLRLTDPSQLHLESRLHDAYDVIDARVFAITLSGLLRDMAAPMPMPETGSPAPSVQATPVIVVPAVAQEMPAPSAEPAPRRRQMPATLRGGHYDLRVSADIGLSIMRAHSGSWVSQSSFGARLLLRSDDMGPWWGFAEMRLFTDFASAGDWSSILVAGGVQRAWQLSELLETYISLAALVSFPNMDRDYWDAPTGWASLAIETGTGIGVRWNVGAAYHLAGPLLAFAEVGTTHVWGIDGEWGGYHEGHLEAGLRLDF